MRTLKWLSFYRVTENFATGGGRKLRYRGWQKTPLQGVAENSVSKSSWKRLATMDGFAQLASPGAKGIAVAMAAAIEKTFLMREI
jgi:hypothetical protein